MKYILYRGYILKGLGEGANVEIYRSAYSETQGLYINVSESEVMAMFRVDREITEGTEGMATQADVDELNRVAGSKGNEEYVTKDGLLLLVVDRNGKQLLSMDISGRDMDDPEAIRELGKAVIEGLPNEAYTKKE